jgi:hypothetical protein
MMTGESFRTLRTRPRMLKRNSSCPDQSPPVPLGTEDRGADLIAEWRRYLPADCVGSMIKCGWHCTV